MARRQDATIPGGAYMRNTRRVPGEQKGDGDVHYGGEVVNAEGDVLRKFGEDEINTGLPKWAEKKKDAKGGEDEEVDWRSTPVDEVEGLDGGTLHALQGAGIGTAGELADRLDKIEDEPIAGLGEARIGKAKEAIKALRD